MKLLLFIGLIVPSLQQTIPYKPKEEFELKLQYEFKQRSVLNNDASTVHYSETEREKERRTSTALLPYVGVSLRVITLGAGEVRVRIVDNKTTVHYNKKVKAEDVIPLNLGFTADMKDRVSPHEYTINFLDEDRKELTRIVISVAEDGTYFVNGEKRGKF